MGHSALDSRLLFRHVRPSSSGLRVWCGRFHVARAEGDLLPGLG